MQIEVFTYEWKYYDGQLDELITRQSDFKVTVGFVESRKTNNMLKAEYRILENTKELVDFAIVIDGKYHPELLPPSFQRQVK